MKYFVTPIQVAIAMLAVFSLPGAAFAQFPVIEWQRCYGGSNTDAGQSIYRTTDSGYIIAGYSGSTDGEVTGLRGSQDDYWVIKLNAAGSIQWERTLGGTNSDLGNSIAQTRDGGYVVSGYSYSNDSDVSGNHGNADYWIVKLNDTGAVQWQKSLGGSAIDIPNSIQQTTDSGYIVAGRSFSNNGDITGHHDSADCWIVKLSPTGNIQWQKSLGGSRGDGATCVRQTFDSGYIVACSSNSADGDVTVNHGDDDVWIVKLSPTGSIQWQRSFGGSRADYASSIQQTLDSGFIVAGSSNSADGDVSRNKGGFDYWILKLSPVGNLQWQRSFGGSSDEFSSSVQQTSDSGYIIAGTTFSDDSDVVANHGRSDIWLVKLTSSGVLQWQRTLGGSDYDDGASIVEVADSEYIVAGTTSSIDPDVTGNHGNSDYWVVKLGPVRDTARDGITTIARAAGPQVSIVPNPATAEIAISSAVEIREITITAISGKCVCKRTCKAKSLNINIAGLQGGDYIVTVNGLMTGEFVKK